MTTYTKNQLLEIRDQMNIEPNNMKYIPPKPLIAEIFIDTIPSKKKNKYKFSSKSRSPNSNIIRSNSLNWRSNSNE